MNDYDMRMSEMAIPFPSLVRTFPSRVQEIRRVDLPLLCEK